MKNLLRYLSHFYILKMCLMGFLIMIFSMQVLSAQKKEIDNIQILNSELDFPLKLNTKEIAFVNSLTELELEKLIKIIRLIVATKLDDKKQDLCTTDLCKKQQEQKDNTIQTQTPNSSGQTPPPYSGASGLTDSSIPSNPNFNPSMAPQNSPVIPPIKQDQMVDFSQLPESAPGSCQNFGVIGNMNGIINKIKFDTSCLCIAFGGPIKVVSGYRPGDPRNHGHGLAIDIAENNYRNRSKDAMLIINLIALGYNIGSYHPGFGSFHADKENSGRWKTWSGVAGTNYQGGLARNYYQQIQDALSLIGIPAISAAQFRATYGSPSQAAMAQKAAAYVNTHGNENMKKCILAR